MPKKFPSAVTDEAAQADDPGAAGTAVTVGNPFLKAKQLHEEQALTERNRVDWSEDDDSLHYIAGRFVGIREYPSKKIAGGKARFAIVVEYDEQTGEPTGRAISIPLHTTLAARLGPLPAWCWVILEYVGRKLSNTGQTFHQWVVTAFDDQGNPIGPGDEVPF